MKARLPKNYNSGETGNLQQIALKVQKEMDDLTDELDAKEYVASASGGLVTVTVNGKPEVLNVEISPEIVNKDDVEMLSDLLIVATNDAIRQAVTEKDEKMNKLSEKLHVPGLF